MARSIPSPLPRSGSRRPSNRPTAIRLYLLAIGRLRRGPLYEVQALYAGRIAPPVTIVELEEKRRLPPAALKLREAELILAARPAGARLVALDPGGANWTSRDLADCGQRQHRRTGGRDRIAQPASDGVERAILHAVELFGSLAMSDNRRCVPDG